jgi:hypothetical protein
VRDGVLVPVRVVIEPPVSPQEALRQQLGWEGRVQEAGAPPGAVWRYVRLWRDGEDVHYAITLPVVGDTRRQTLSGHHRAGGGWEAIVEPYTVEMIGAVVDGPLTPPFFRLNNLEVWVGPERHRYQISMGVCWESARYGDSRAYLERRWDEDLREERAVRWPKDGPQPPEREILHAYRGLGVLTALPGSHKEAGDGVETPDEFLDRLEDALTEWWRKRSNRGAPPSEKEAAKAYGLGKTAFHTRLEDNRIRWPSVKSWRPGARSLRDWLGRAG